MRNLLRICAVALLLPLSCKKTATEQHSTATAAALPAFTSVDPDQVFAGKQAGFQNRDSVVQVVNRYYQNIWEGGDLWGGFLVAKGDEILYEKYRGYGAEGGAMPINENTPLHVASISKTLTAMAVMKLIEAGKIGLNDELSKYFPQFPYAGVTVKSLLTQRSGLPKYEYFLDKLQPKPAELAKPYLTNTDILSLLIRYKPETSRAPETGFVYCNTNFALLALLVEQVTNTPFPQAMQDIVFRPLKMLHTYVYTPKDSVRSSHSFYFRGPVVYPLDHLDMIYGDKNVYTTPRDLLNFSKAIYSDHFLRKDLAEMVFVPYSNEKPGIKNYGIGFRLKVYDNGDILPYHTGWWHGTNSVFAHLLKSDVTIVAIGNKFSRKVYSALSLASLFEDFPLERDRLRATLGEADSLRGRVDSVATGDE